MGFDKEIKLGDTFQELPKSKLQVQHADNIGHFPFYTSGDSVLTHSEFNVDDEIIFLATGGKANVKFHSGKAAYSTDTYAIKGKDHSSKYLFYLLLNNLSFIDRNFFSGSGLKHLQKKDFRNWLLNFPDETNEEERIVQFLSTLDRAIASTEQLVDKYQRIKTGLLHDLLTCGIDENGNLRNEKTHKFKVSKLGRIPEEWECKPLGEYSSIQGGYAFRSKDFVKSGIQLLRIGNLFNNKLSLEREPVYLPNSFNKEFSNFLLQRGDVILSMTGTYGKRDYGFAIKIEEGRFLLNQRVCRFWPKDNLTTNYLFHLLHSEFYLTQLFNSVTGSKQGNLNSNNILDNYVTIPNENEQKKISLVLDKVDKILNTQEVNLSKLQSLKAGLMQDLLSGKVRIKY